METCQKKVNKEVAEMNGLWKGKWKGNKNQLSIMKIRKSIKTSVLIKLLFVEMLKQSASLDN